MMDKEMLDLCQRFGHLPSGCVILHLGGCEYLPFHWFDGHGFADFGDIPGMWCYYTPRYEDILYLSEADNLSRPDIPRPVRKIADLLQYKVCIAFPQYYPTPEDERRGLLDEDEDMQGEFRRFLLWEFYHANSILLKNPYI